MTHAIIRGKNGRRHEGCGSVCGSEAKMRQLASLSARPRLRHDIRFQVLKKRLDPLPDFRKWHEV
jgi:hypothetical protein